MEITAHESGPEEVTIDLAGELDLNTAQLLTSAVRQQDRHRAVRLDLASLTFVDCAGLHAIETEQVRLAQCGVRLEVVHVGARVRRVLQLAGLDQIEWSGIQPRPGRVEEPRVGTRGEMIGP